MRCQIATYSGTPKNSHWPHTHSFGVRKLKLNINSLLIAIIKVIFTIQLCNIMATHFITQMSSVHMTFTLCTSPNLKCMSMCKICASTYKPRQRSFSFRLLSAVRIHVTFAFLGFLCGCFRWFVPFLCVFRLFRRRPFLSSPFRSSVFEPHLCENRRKISLKRKPIKTCFQWAYHLSVIEWCYH